ncbi:MAG: hypothetical protein A3C35_00850 [Omnitrophica bacterium RIFCSPHIGHO2_02_FULL_46_11]|nr:MAG: hypothetical protein A3C35_00850 [Omnitrophica bacterium RIFCSPHIGHO2_02_FULL_46_11]
MLIKEKDKKKHMIKMKRNKRGFTLGEMVTTVAIIGTLTAVSVPNYMRVRMQVNMEMVKQHLKTIGTHMNDLYNRNKQFPQNINQLGSSGEEVAITASLFGINRREYTTDGYTTGPNLTTFQLRTCPQAGRWGIAGDRCFTLTPLGIGEDSGNGAAAFGVGASWGNSVPVAVSYGRTTSGKYFLGNSANPTNAERIEFMVAQFEVSALWLNYNSDFKIQNTLDGPALSFIDFKESTGNFKLFEPLLPSVIEALKAKGIYLTIKERPVADSVTTYLAVQEALGRPENRYMNPSYYSSYYSQAFEFSFQMAQPAKNIAEVEARTASAEQFSNQILSKYYSKSGK